MATLPLLRIGELARRTGASAKAIRLYEARGLLGRVARAGTYRQYGEDDVARVQLIRQALALGFRLAELDGLHALPSAQGWQQVAALVAAHPMATWVARFESVDACVTPVLTLSEALAHPLLADRQQPWMTVD